MVRYHVSVTDVTNHFQGKTLCESIIKHTRVKSLINVTSVSKRLLRNHRLKLMR